MSSSDFWVSPGCWILFQPINILGAELLECLYWRKGALLYMYCHTAKERREWLRGNIAIFKKVKKIKKFYKHVNTVLKFDFTLKYSFCFSF